MSFKKYISTITCKFSKGGIVDYNYKIRHTNNTQDIATIEPSEKTVKINKEVLSFKEYIDNNVSIKAKGDFNITPNKIVVKKGDTEDVVFDKANNIDHRNSYTFRGVKEDEELIEYEVLFTYEKKESCNVTLKVDSDHDNGWITIDSTGEKVKQTELVANPNESFDAFWDRLFDFEPEEGYMLYMIKRRKEDGTDDTLFEHRYVDKDPEIDIVEEYNIDTDMTFEILFIEQKQSTVILNLKKGENNDDAHITELKQEKPIPAGMSLLDAMDEEYIKDDYEKQGQEYLYRLGRIVSKKGGSENVLYDYINKIDKREEYKLVEDNEEIIFESMGIQKEVKIELLNVRAPYDYVKFKEADDTDKTTMTKRINLYDTDYDTKNMSYTDLLTSYQYNSDEPIVWDNIVFNSEHGGEDKIKMKRITFVEEGKTPSENDYIFDFKNDATVNDLGEIISFTNASKYIMQIEFEIRDEVVLTFKYNDNQTNPFNKSHITVNNNIRDILKERMDNMVYQGKKCDFLTTKNCISFTEEGDIDIKDTIFGKVMLGIGNQFRATSTNYTDIRNIIIAKESQDYYANYQVYEKSGDESTVKYPIVFNLVYKNDTGHFFDCFTLVCYVEPDKNYSTMANAFPSKLNILDVENKPIFEGLYEYGNSVDTIGKTEMAGNNDSKNLNSLNTYKWGYARTIDVLYV